MMYPWRDADERRPLLDWVPGIRPFTGAIPRSPAPGSSPGVWIRIASLRRRSFAGGSSAITCQGRSSA